MSHAAPSDLAVHAEAVTRLIIAGVRAQIDWMDGGDQAAVMQQVCDAIVNAVAAEQIPTSWVVRAQDFIEAARAIAARADDHSASDTEKTIGEMLDAHELRDE